MDYRPNEDWTIDKPEEYGFGATLNLDENAMGREHYWKPQLFQPTQPLAYGL